MRNWSWFSVIFVTIRIRIILFTQRNDVFKSLNQGFDLPEHIFVHLVYPINAVFKGFKRQRLGLLAIIQIIMEQVAPVNVKFDSEGFYGAEHTLMNQFVAFLRFFVRLTLICICRNIAVQVTDRFEHSRIHQFVIVYTLSNFLTHDIFR